MPAMRFLLLVVVGTMTLGGLLDQIHVQRDDYTWLTAEEITLAEQVRAATPADAVFATGLQSSHPVSMLGGRLVVMSYRGWLWPRGIDTAPTERDLRRIFALDPAAPALIAAHNISFVVIDTWVRENFTPNEAGYRARYPVVAETEHYVVFDVRG
ncbi:MAG: hypothetical protein H0W06_12435 [Chloroflexia bacterium]|nr:hypothetical protein [Chloroflexia bacterium]